MTATPRVLKLDANEVELDALPGIISLPGLLLFTRSAVRDIAVKSGIDPDSGDIDDLHAEAIAGFDAVCDLRDSLAGCRPDDPVRRSRWEAFMGALEHIGYLLHNGRTHDGKTIRFV